MTNTIHCQLCGALLPSDMPAGLCPGCLLRTALQTGTQDFPTLPKLPYFGDYELLEEIARGGMGVIYKARQVSLDRIVAVKMMRPGLLATEEEIKRFHAEATAAANLQHPNIVSIYEVGEQDGLHYFSMEYIAGTSLAQVVQQHPLLPSNAARHVQTVAEAIHYAHTKGTLHRDLKPSNVLVDLSDHLHITDFGLAKQIHTETTLTLTGAVLGTPNYMAPEQAGAANGHYGPTSDVYALGAILYELVTGKPPFLAATPLQTMKLVLEAEPVSPRVITPGLSRDLETICLKCLAKEPRKRYQSAQELADDLGRFLRGEPILARPVSAPTRMWRWCRRNPWPTVAAVSLVAIAVLATVSAIAFRQRLWNSLLQQARLQRLTGNRNDEMETLKQAARIRNNSDLRQEAIQMAITPGARLLFRIPFGAIKKTVFSADSRLIAVAGQYVYGPNQQKPESPPDVKVWELKSQRPLARTETDDAGRYLFSPDAKELAVVSDSRQKPNEYAPEIVLSQPAAGRDIARYSLTDRCGKQPSSSVGTLLFSPDSRYLVNTNSDSEVGWLFSLADRRFVDCVPGAALAFSSNSELLIKQKDELKKLDLSLGQVRKQTQPVEVDGGPVIVPRWKSQPSAKAELVALSSNGRIAVVHKQALIVWDLAENRELGRIDTPDNFQILLNQDGRFLLLYSPSDPSHLQIWAQTPQGLRSQWILLPKGSRIILEPEQGQASFSTDGRVLAALVAQGAQAGIWLWNTETGEMITELPDHHSPVWSEDGHLLATTGGRDIKLPDDGPGHGSSLTSTRGFPGFPRLSIGNAYEVIWEITYPTPVYHLAEAVSSLSFSPNGKQLVANSAGWNIGVSHGRVDLIVFTTEHLGAYAAFDNAGRLWEAEFESKGWPVEKSGVGHSIRIWEHMPEKQEILLHNPGYANMGFKHAGTATMTHTGKKVQGYLTVRATRAVVSPNGQRAVVAAEVWTEYPEPASGSSGAGEGILELWDLTTGNRIAILNQGEWQKTIRPVAFTPDSRVLLTFANERTHNLAVSLWDATTGRLLRKIPLWDNEFTAPPQDLVVFAADGKTLFTARPSFRENGSNVIRISDFASGREIRHWEYEGGQIHALAVSPDGIWLATAGIDHMIRLWEVTSGRELARWEAHDSAVTALSFYPQGKMLASGAEDGSVKVWDLDGIRRELSSIGLGW